MKFNQSESEFNNPDSIKANSQELWKRFISTGSINDYLLFSYSRHNMPVHDCNNDKC